ncbi:MAG: hypothetical protein QHJ73_12985, partial [Armatimonadota bacterium]|nr:hypothetical protein [Armatimonadota bacterium]
MTAAFVIWHTNDLHNRLTDADARRLRDLKSAERGSLLLDAGDALRSGNLGIPWRGEGVLD